MGFPQRPEHLPGSARGDRQRVCFGCAEYVKRAADIVVRMQHRRRQISEGGDRPTLTAILKEELMRL